LLDDPAFQRNGFFITKFCSALNNVEIIKQALFFMLIVHINESQQQLCAVVQVFLYEKVAQGPIKSHKAIGLHVCNR
jgi:hypothetical protein